MTNVEMDFTPTPPMAPTLILTKVRAKMFICMLGDLSLQTVVALAL